jgi:hypothetical protein
MTTLVLHAQQRVKHLVQRATAPINLLALQPARLEAPGKKHATVQSCSVDKTEISAFAEMQTTTLDGQ